MCICICSGIFWQPPSMFLVQQQQQHKPKSTKQWWLNLGKNLNSSVTLHTKFLLIRTPCYQINQHMVSRKHHNKQLFLLLLSNRTNASFGDRTNLSYNKVMHFITCNGSCFWDCVQWQNMKRNCHLYIKDYSITTGYK